MDKSKRGSHGGNGKSSLLGKDLGRSGSPGAHFLSLTSPREPLSCPGSRRIQSRVTKTLSPACTQLPVHFRAWRGSRNLLKSRVLPQNHNPSLPWASISSCQHKHHLWIMPRIHPHVPNPTGTLPCPPGLADNSIPPATSSPLHKPGFHDLQETPWKCLLAVLPLPAAKKGLPRSSSDPKILGSH